MAKIIALIPARGGSKSIPFKNIKLLGGKPLIYWTLNAASNCNLIDKVYLATDNYKIKNITLDFGLPKVHIFNRNSLNAQDTSSTESLMLEFIEKHKLQSQDILILLQATSPFTTSTHLTEALLQFKNNKNHSLLSVVEFKRFIWNKHGVAINYNPFKRPRRQDFVGNYVENGAIYISTIHNIILNKNRLTNNPGLYIMPPYTSLELDELSDWIIAEEYIKYLTHK